MLRIMTTELKTQFKTQTLKTSDRPLTFGHLGNWLFLLGSLIFTFDSVSEILAGFSWRAIGHISACLAFTIGSIILIFEGQKKI
jgi:hypothetical protein